jgi:AP endonuclease 2
MSKANDCALDKDDNNITLCSWNINGIASYWKSHGKLSNALDFVSADIICFQETKVAAPLDWYSSIADKYHSYFSLHRPAKAYSGTATFVNKVLPTLKAQDGLCGHFCKCDDDLIVRVRAAEVSFSAEELLQLDSEGRCVITGISTIFHSRCANMCYAQTTGSLSC